MKMVSLANLADVAPVLPARRHCVATGKVIASCNRQGEQRRFPLPGGEGQGEGERHTIFYPDGTIRDPSIPMVVMGIFRNRGPDVVLERPNREGRVTRVIAKSRDWLAAPNADWHTGLDIAEEAAHLLESGQLVPLHELPTRQVARLRRGPVDRPALVAVLEKDIAALQPYSQ